MEFVEGASRLRGHAKTLDLWRIETKLEAGKITFCLWGRCLTCSIDNTPVVFVKSEGSSNSLCDLQVKSCLLLYRYFSKRFCSA